MKSIFAIAAAATTLTLGACASDGSGPTLSIGMGSFGGSGGVSGSVTTELPVGGSDDETPLPNAQLYLSDTVIDEVFPDQTIPFTADVNGLDQLNAYAETNPTAITDENRTRLRQCLDAKAKCRVQRVE